MTTNGAYPVHPREASAEALLDRLSEPRTAEALHRLLDHAELLAFSAGALDGLVRRGEAIADNIAAGVAEVKQAIPADSGQYVASLSSLAGDLPALSATAGQLARLSASPEFKTTMETLGDPATLSALTTLLGNMDLLVFGVAAVDGAMRRGEELTDNIRASLTELREKSAGGPLDLEQLVGAANDLLPRLPALIATMNAFLPMLPRLATVAPKFIDVIERLEPFVASPEFDALLSSGVFHPHTVQVVGQAGDAFAETYDESRRQPKRLNILGMLRSLGDPDIQRAASLVVAFGKRFGQSLKK
ncbi:DUF1641 domain-containing protein [Oscillochloris sp. ZM17-4]|uniref:DUF1641 domain-containing protein n=1 Tax=Oscillochloris sp. ZM17-4 TaxID=2866714 RepID=UPI001C72F1A1|nr:DUF1641 domain-containing protein [Oscillochloris sp. ZM17-4]MBX0329182.1 DUF1641 domain-containing protein [Oscillochloris sp. ZM17-4]